MQKFLPEGSLINTSSNQAYISSIDNLNKAKNDLVILEGFAQLCTYSHELIIQLPCIKAIMPREECAIGIKEGKTKDVAIISRVGKPVCFIVIGFEERDGERVAIVSRKIAQERCVDEYISNLVPGEVIDAKVTHMEQFGCFVDIGCGIPSMIPIDSISVSRISHPSDRFDIGDLIKVIVKNKDEDKVYISHKELLGTWSENASLFNAGETVNGIVRSVESYGIFVELTPNLAGLAEPKPDVHVGQTASVYIKSINEDKMKIKLIIVDAYDFEPIKENRYFIEDGIIESWRYSPLGCKKQIETIF